MVTTNGHGLPEIKVDNSFIKISGSEEAATLMDLIFTSVGLEFNFNKICKEAYQRCRDDIMCNYYLGGLPSLLNQLSSDHLKHENGTAYAELQMEEIIEGKDDDFHRNLLKSMSQNLDELKT